MKVVVIGRTITDMPKGIVSALQELNIHTVLIPLTEFYRGCTYWQRKLYKFGYKKQEILYNNNLIASISKTCADVNPDFILLLDGVEVSIPILQALKNYKLILNMWDVLAEFPEFAERSVYYDYVFTFEKDDAKIIKNKFSYDNCSYLPVGYDENIYFPQKAHQKYDISFVGMPKGNRLEILDAIAKIAHQKNLSMKICGPWYDDNHFWKKRQFQLQHPYLAPYICNGFFSSAECADIYRKSKICLNINACDRKSLNPRTFDILATESFQIMNHGQDGKGIIDLDKSLVQYKDTDDLIAKILYFLADDDARNQIAHYGCQQVQTLSNTALMKKMLAKLKEKRII